MEMDEPAGLQLRDRNGEELISAGPADSLAEAAVDRRIDQSAVILARSSVHACFQLDSTPTLLPDQEKTYWVLISSCAGYNVGVGVWAGLSEALTSDLSRDSQWSLGLTGRLLLLLRITVDCQEPIIRRSANLPNTLNFINEEFHEIREEKVENMGKESSTEGMSRGKVKLHPPPPVTTDSTVSSSCSGQLLQNGCRGSAADENPLNASCRFLRFSADMFTPSRFARCEKKPNTQEENHLMEDKKKKKQEEKKKKEAAQKKATEQITKVPDSAKLDPTPPLPPINPSTVPSVLLSSGNGKRTPSGGQPQTAQQPQTLLQQRYPPREVPPRFRQQEHKQLLKRGQPLPSGTLPLATTGRPCSTEPAAAAAVAIHSSPSCFSSSTGFLCSSNYTFHVLTVEVSCLAHTLLTLEIKMGNPNCPHKAAREPSMIIPSGDTCQPTGVPQVLHLPPISVVGIN
ncbi:hypothetical protein INR49_011167 [Caranx melampygus]|nr:hypothetical protein INR49_011167 [Caranx melampygus]